MQTVTKKYEVFTFAELDDSAKKTAIQRYAETLDYDWWDSVEECFRTVASLIGIDVDRIHFSGFWSQGDGACFEGSYSYLPGWRAALRAEFGGDLLARFEAIGEQLQAIQRMHFYQAHATMRHSGRYQHSGCMDVSVDFSDCPNCDSGFEHCGLDADSYEEIRDTMRSLADDLYRMLENEYEHLTSEENVADMSEANDWQYTEDGELFV